MCLTRQLDATSRRIRAAANFCLISGLMLPLFFKGVSFALRHPDFYLVVRFVLISSAIVLMLWSSRRSEACIPPPERNS